jgi:hypothetical protein
MGPIPCILLGIPTSDDVGSSQVLSIIVQMSILSPSQTAYTRTFGRSGFELITICRKW